METVIATYADDDSNFADRLVLDLSESQIPTTYDKWLLRGGDSIIEKIAQTEVASDGVIALVSPNSVESAWVQKDLSFAMTGEIEKQGIKVFPARIADCEIPANLTHKLYADFSRGYYRGPDNSSRHSVQSCMNAKSPLEKDKLKALCSS